MTTDYPDWSRLIQVLGSNIMIPIDVQASYIMMPIDIQGQYVTLDIDIAAQSVGNINVDIAAMTVGTIEIDIAAQTISELKIDIEAQSIGVYLQPDWAAKEGDDKNFYALGGEVATGNAISVQYTPTAPKTLFLVSAGCSLAAYAAENRNNNQICCLNIQVAGSTVFALGGNGGASAMFPKPIKISGGVELTIAASNFSNQNGILQVAGFGYEV